MLTSKVNSAAAMNTSLAARDRSHLVSKTNKAKLSDEYTSRSLLQS